MDNANLRFHGSTIEHQGFRAFSLKIHFSKVAKIAEILTSTAVVRTGNLICDRVVLRDTLVQSRSEKAHNLPTTNCRGKNGLKPAGYITNTGLPATVSSKTANLTKTCCRGKEVETLVHDSSSESGKVAASNQPRAKK